METRLLEAFLAVADYLNFSRAAESLYISQPTLSKQIHELEQLLGVQLFFRSGRPVSLTEQGKRILPIARHIVADIELMRQGLAGSGDEFEANSIFYVGIDSRLLQNTACKLRISHALNLLHKKYPNLKINTRRLVEQECTQSVLQRQDDVTLSLLYEKGGGAEQINSTVFLEDSLVLMVSNEVLEELGSSDPAVILSKMSIMRNSQDIRELATFSNISEALRCDSTVEYYENVDLAFMDLCAGKGVLLLPKAFQSEFSTEILSAIEIPGDIARIYYSFFWLKDNLNPYINELYNFLKLSFRMR